MPHQSEVARLRQQIDDECEAMQQAMNGFAQTASHAFINQKYDNLGAAQDQLEQLVGEDAAAQIVVETYRRKMG